MAIDALELPCVVQVSLVTGVWIPGRQNLGRGRGGEPLLLLERRIETFDELVHVGEALPICVEAPMQPAVVAEDGDAEVLDWRDRDQRKHGLHLSAEQMKREGWPPGCSSRPRYRRVA